MEERLSARLAVQQEHNARPIPAKQARDVSRNARGRLLSANVLERLAMHQQLPTVPEPERRSAEAAQIHDQAVTQVIPDQQDLRTQGELAQVDADLTAPAPPPAVHKSDE